MSGKSYGAEDEEFLAYLRDTSQSLKPVRAKNIFSPAETCAVITVDITNGFCKKGTLASPRVNAIIPPIVDLLTTAWNEGVRHLVLSQDTHDAKAKEFLTWPAHCIRGTVEAETVDEIKRLPFYNAMILMEKNSLSSLNGTRFGDWLNDHPELATFIVTGDCTDLCIYQLAMDLRTNADARQVKWRVIVPANCVQTYDFPTAAAQKAGARPHPGDLMHDFFLYHLALNGIDVVSRIN